MATSVTIDASALNALIGRFDGAQEVVEREGNIALERSAILVQNSAKENLQQSGAIDTGQLINSIAIDRASPMQRAIGTDKSYGEVVEVGRRKGAPMPPAGVLLGWLARHGIPAEKEFIVRKRISQRGIPERPYLVPALEDNEPAMNREFDLAADRALAELMR